MGGLSRKIAYINTLKNNKINPIILDAGDALFTHSKYSLLRLPSEKYKAKAFLEGYEKIGCDALNVGEYDLAAGYEFLKSLEQNSTIPFISANLRVKETNALAFKPFVIINRNKLRIGIIGVTDYLSAEVNDLYKENYLSTGHEMINMLRGNVDILIMLVNSNMNQKNTILESFKDADYIYLSRTVSNTRSAVPQKDGYPIFYTIGLNGKHLIEVKTTIKNDKKPIVDVSSFETKLSRVVRQLNRLKTTSGNQTIEEKYADKPEILEQINYYEKQVKEIKDGISKAVNTSELKIVALPKNMDFDTEMQSFVNNVLKESKNQ
jgi:2',3'-cyclic-nucleotide 2'-phosphodiesterase (5'-nucleotidase family)